MKVPPKSFKIYKSSLTRQTCKISNEMTVKKICRYMTQLRALLRDKYVITINPFTEKKTMLRKAMGTST